MTRKGRRPVQKWSMYQNLHDEVSRLLEEESLNFQFYDIDNDLNCIRQRDSNVMGRLKCYSPKCKSDGWSSRKIAITIRMYLGQKYNARVYHQRCKSCNALSQPVLDESYAERVTYWIKKWNGITVERPRVVGDSRGPHNRQLCEGCKAGHCSESRNILISQMLR